jgi:uncharacterized membrane protein YqgA involved in biofilm formation
MVPLTVYQGGIAILAHVIGPVLSDAVINEMSAVGGLLIVALGLNMLEATKTRIRVANLLPAIFFPIATCRISVDQQSVLGRAGIWAYR